MKKIKRCRLECNAREDAEMKHTESVQRIERTAVRKLNNIWDSLNEIKEKACPHIEDNVQQLLDHIVDAKISIKTKADKMVSEEKRRCKFFIDRKDKEQRKTVKKLKRSLDYGYTIEEDEVEEEVEEEEDDN